MASQKFSIGEVEIEAIIEGSGDYIVLLPGLGSDASTYEQFTPMFNDAGYQTVAINLRGISKSSGPLKGLTLHDLANDVAAVVELLEAAPVHIVGWAFGNRVARCLAVDRPGLVKTLILLAAGGKTKPDSEAMKQLLRLYQPNLTRDEKIKAAQISLFSPATNPDKILDTFENRKGWRKATIAHSKANQSTPVEDWWSGGDVPMLVIQGLDDRIAPPGNGRSLRDEFSERVKLIELENTGHALVYEQPELIAKEIISYLQGY
jgi:pimeloyl-ACP methyl ester carboxylesterase